MTSSPYEHTIDPTITHHKWQKSLPVALQIESGATVHFDLAMAADGQLEFTSKSEEVTFDWETMYVLSGPIYVKGAAPGDTLQVDILKLTPGPWGWAGIVPGLGLLPEDFTRPYLKTFDLSNGSSTVLTEGVRIPFSPFLGTMGVHPDEPDDMLPFPPHRGGGNMDNRHLQQGTTLWLPIWCDGALFSCGDPHACQGDGEVCVSALECGMQATLRFTLHKRAISAPQLTVPAGQPAPLTSGGYHATMGIGDDLMECARAATRSMIAWIVENHGLSREDAFILCSLAGDLKIHEVVDSGMWNVGMTLPFSVFDTSHGRL